MRSAFLLLVGGAIAGAVIYVAARSGADSEKPTHASPAANAVGTAVDQTAAAATQTPEPGPQRGERKGGAAPVAGALLADATEEHLVKLGAAAESSTEALSEARSIEERFASEPHQGDRSPGWEREMRSRLRNLPRGIKVAEVDCRRTLCRVSIDGTRAPAAMPEVLGLLESEEGLAGFASEIVIRTPPHSGDAAGSLTSLTVFATVDGD